MLPEQNVENCHRYRNAILAEIALHFFDGAQYPHLGGVFRYL
jgi:hypothetical protein